MKKTNKEPLFLKTTILNQPVFPRVADSTFFQDWDVCLGSRRVGLPLTRVVLVPGSRPERGQSLGVLVIDGFLFFYIVRSFSSSDMFFAETSNFSGNCKEFQLLSDMVFAETSNFSGSRG
ncbi:hypothetical protein ACOMHN_023753 [Nucella lapillus]